MTVSHPVRSGHLFRRRIPLHAGVLALILLVVVASIWAPATLSSAGLEAIAPMGTFLAITALGQMLVIMTGGIDLSVPGTFLGGLLMVGVGQQSDERIWIAYLTAIGVAAGIGLLNGILIGGLKLNPLIVTLAVGQPSSGSPAATTARSQSRSRCRPTLGVGQRHLPRGDPAFLGRGRPDHPPRHHLQVHRGGPQVPGGRRQPRRLDRHGPQGQPHSDRHLRRGRDFYATAGVLLAGFLRAPGVTVGAPYLLGPIAAVVIGGASLTGGLASPVSTFAAAFFLARQPDDARVEPSHRVAVRGLRAGDRGWDAGFWGQDHQRGGEGPARPLETSQPGGGSLVAGGEP